MTDTNLAFVEQQLSVIVRLLAALVVRSTLDPGASQQDRIGVLSAAGLETAQIAEILGTTSATVRSAVARARKRPN
jgi:DNA-directed RNA polymerase specialized sigma24 family protein